MTLGGYLRSHAAAVRKSETYQLGRGHCSKARSATVCSAEKHIMEPIKVTLMFMPAEKIYERKNRHRGVIYRMRKHAVVEVTQTSKVRRERECGHI